jgi:type IV pilus assembly protein PilO
MAAFGKLKWQVQVLIVVLVCGAAMGGVWYMLLSPLSVDIKTKEEQVAKLKPEVDKMLALEVRYAQFKKEADLLEKRLNELKKVLPQDKEIEQILSLVQQSARSAGLKIERGISKPVVDHDVYSEWPLEMQVFGTYHNLGAFLEKIREIPRIVNVGKLRLEGRAGKNEEGNSTSIGATYEATTFVYREPSAEMASAQPVKGKK